MPESQTQAGGGEGQTVLTMVREALASEGFRDDLAEAWLSGVNESLGGITPLTALDEDRGGEVLAVARAFARGRVPGPPNPPKPSWHRPVA